MNTKGSHMMLEERINEIGCELVKCRKRCAGICNKPEEGILPRCLIYQGKNGNEDKGVVIVGLNPGHASKKEKDFYQNNNSYEEVKAWWNQQFAQDTGNEPNGGHYYSKLRYLANRLGLNGPILWTEVVHCENENGTGGLTFNKFPQTFRACMRDYLLKEMERVPSTWKVIAVTREAYSVARCLFLDHGVIGVPHPRSQGQEFQKLFDAEHNIRPEVRDQVGNILKCAPETVWMQFGLKVRA